MDLSVIIPCYNHGHFIQDAIDSVELLEGVAYEIIIVDDGSSDINTRNKLTQLANSGYKVINQSNSGLARTRNVGINMAVGKFILPLDSDNKIKPEYVYRAIEILNSVNVDIVYAKPVFFGDHIPQRFFITREFNGYELFDSNYIDACAIFKKDVWLSVGGYDEAMPRHGQEDWEFWVNAFVKGYKFYYIDEPLFYYRVLKGSMIESTVATGYGQQNHEYIVKKHVKAYIEAYRKITTDSKIYNRDKSMPFRSSLKYLYKFINSSFSSFKI